ncbi:MAG: hypothetical protein LUB61_02255 [Eggerthellaceae bacterium]|nr:hypothetical protein [Eggerthellaceae bacterium]
MSRRKKHTLSTYWTSWQGIFTLFLSIVSFIVLIGVVIVVVRLFWG